MASNVNSPAKFRSGLAPAVRPPLMYPGSIFLSRMADEPADWNQQKIGELTYIAEVKEFNEPGGMMDQYSTAMGYLIYLESKPKISIQSLNPNLGTFVLGDSNEPKDTMGILARCRDARLTIWIN